MSLRTDGRTGPTDAMLIAISPEPIGRGIKTKLKKGRNLAKTLLMIINIELDLYFFTMIYPSANFH